MQVLRGIHLIEGRHGAANAYLIDGEELVLIDTGGVGTGRRIARYIESMGRSITDLRLIILTHLHWDHTGSARWLGRRSGASVLAHAAEATPSRNGGLALVPNAFGPWGFIIAILRALLRRPRPVPLSGVLQDGQVLPVMGGLRVVHAPGHSPGSVCLYLERSRVLFPGDLIVSNVGRLSRPYPRGDEHSRVQEQSLQKLRGLEVDAVLPSHGKPVLDGAEARLSRLLDLPPRPFSWRRLLKHMATSLFHKEKSQG